MNYNQEVSQYLFSIWGKIKNRNWLQIVWEDFYTKIPSQRENLYLLIWRTSWDVLRLLANIEYSRMNWWHKEQAVWLTAQICKDEHSKYWKHFPIHGKYSLRTPEEVALLL
jgi:hypothetical protein